MLWGVAIRRELRVGYSNGDWGCVDFEYLLKDEMARGMMAMDRASVKDRDVEEDPVSGSNPHQLLVLALRADCWRFQ